MKVAQLNLYPVKSGAPVTVTEAKVEMEGLRADRRFMVVRPNGEFITARKQPKLLGVTALFQDNELVLSTPESGPVKVDVSALPENYSEVNVWKDHLQAQSCTAEADELLTQWLETDARLVYLGPKSRRAFRQDGTVSFADGAPLLVTTTASLESLNNALDTPVTMGRFRPNIVIEGAEPFEEHTWSSIQVGSVTLEMVWACERCVLTTIDEKTWTKDPNNEPLRTLRKLNRDERGKINFGQNAAAVAPGIIRVGDSVEIAAISTA